MRYHKAMRMLGYAVRGAGAKDLSRGVTSPCGQAALCWSVQSMQPRPPLWRGVPMGQAGVRGEQG